MAAFGGGGFGNQSGFGQTTSAFGSNAFGNSSGPFGGQPAFGSQSNPLFSSQPQSYSAFGQSAPFGGNSFGTQSATAFGSGFGNSGFGSQSNPAFGSGYGAQSSSAFGASGGFGSGSSLFGSNRPPTGAFGDSNSFGQSQSGWGQSSSGFGGSLASGGGLFGSSGPSNAVFGQSSSAFGAGNQVQKGTVGVSWQITTEYDGGPGQSSKYHSITMMNQFRDRSIEELRVEDYVAGNKGGNARNTGSHQSGGLFGNAGNTFGASSGGFGSGNAFGNVGGLGPSSSAGAFGQSSSGGMFGGGGFGAPSGFGQSGGGAFASGNTFGTQSGSGMFGQSVSAFGSQSTGGFGNTNTSLFGSASGFGNPQTGTVFGTGGGFGGAQQSQPAFGGGSSQPGLFGPPSQPIGGSGFVSAGGAQSTPSLFGANPGQQSLFGGGASGFNNSGGQKPLFGSVGGNAFGGTTFGSSAPANAGGTSFGGFNAVQSAPSYGTSIGGAGFGAQPGQQQAQMPNAFGGSVVPSGQNFAAPPGAGNNPTLQGTFTAVTQQNGATVAPPGANYGTVLYNLQKLQSEIGEHKKLLEQQAKTSAANTPQPPGAVSVVVLPSPPLISFSGTERRASVSGYGWSGTNSQRTKMRGVAGRVGGVATKISGTPVWSLEEQASDGAPPTLVASGSDVVRRMSFFSPQHFSGALKPRTIRASELSTPIPTTPKMLPLPERLEGGAIAGSDEQQRRPVVVLDDNSPGNQNGREHADRNPSPQSHIHMNSVADRIKRSSRQAPHSTISGQMTFGAKTAGVDNPAPGDESKITTRRRSRSDNAAGVNDANFIWAQQRPSSWSLNRPVDSDEQYNPHKYLPSQTKSGFYTVPSMGDLASRTMTELQQVEKFTVGREGYGEITWIDPVDVRGINLDAVVDIQRGEVAVYPEKEAQQLDAPARVKLEGMFRKKKKSETTVSEEEMNERYKQKLRNYCNRNDLRFIGYNAANGEWVFEVQTFAD